MAIMLFNLQQEVAKLLLFYWRGEYIDLNATNNVGWTAFMFHCKEGHQEVVKLLLETFKTRKKTKNELFKIAVNKWNFPEFVNYLPFTKRLPFDSAFSYQLSFKMRANMQMIFAANLILVSLISASRQFDDKIVNGQDATQGQFPYQVSWCFDNDVYCFNFCGGSIFTETTIITAAHCCDAIGKPTKTMKSLIGQILKLWLVN